LMYSDDTEASTQPRMTPTEVLSAEMMGFGALIALSLFDRAQQCGSSLSPYFYGSLFVVAAAVAHTCAIYVKSELRGLRLRRAWYTLMLVVISIAPFLALIPLQGVLASDSIDAPLLVMAVWLLLTAGNANMLRGPISAGAVLATAIAVVLLLYVALPLGLERSSKTASLVAETLGIKSADAVRLLLSRKACLVVQAAASELPSGEPIACDKEEGNFARAVVLSNVGARWVLALPQGGHQSHLSLPRVTVPGDAVQVFDKGPDRPGMRDGCRQASRNGAS
jgi:hypothetical protein